MGGAPSPESSPTSRPRPPVQQSPTGRRASAPAGEERKKAKKSAGNKDPAAATAEATESSALSEIGNVALSVSADLDKVIDSSLCMGERLEIFALREISSFTSKLRGDLGRMQQETMLAASAAPLPPPKKYDDPLLQRARRIAELTNKLCDDIDNTSTNFSGNLQESKDAGSLSEITLATRQVCEDMSKLQAEGWAQSVLASVPKKADEPPPEREKKVEPEKKGEAEASEQEDEQQEEEEKIEGLGDLDEFLNDATDDQVSDAEVERWRLAFKRFKIPDSGDLHTGDICGLLSYLGHVIVSEEIVMPLVEEITSYEYIDFDEFVAFMEKYIPVEREQFKIVFDKFDEDNSGEIDLHELRQLMTGLGFIPLHAMMAEALAYVDKDKNAALGFEELIQFLACFRHAEGFAKPEVADLRKVFDRFAKRAAEGPAWMKPDKSVKKPPQLLLPGDMICDALVQAFGLHVSEFADEFERQMKSGQGLQKSSFAGSHAGGKSEMLTFPEFLIFARKTREQSMKALMKRCPGMAKGQYGNLKGEDAVEFTAMDEDGSGTISTPEIKVQLKKMGYTALKQNIEEILREVDKDASGEMDFNEFFDFSLIYREREGFSKQSMDAMRAVFNRYDDDGSGEISAVELGDLFRHLGYKATLDELHLFVVQVDENGSQQLDFREYLKLMRLHREEEFKNVRKVFDQNADAETNLLKAEHIEMTLLALDYELPERMQEEVLARKEVDFDDFVEIMDDSRRDVVARERKKAGFNDEKIAQFQEMFDHFDKDHGGEIDNKELMELLKEFNWEPTNKEEQKALVKKIQLACERTKEAGVEDVGGEGEIKFWTFIQLCRILETEQETQEEERMEALMRELQFSPREVDEFREVFMAKTADVQGNAELANQTRKVQPGLPRPDVKRLIRSLGVSLTGENRDKLDAQLVVLHCTSDVAQLDFGGFLRLMRWIMDTNFGGVGAPAPPGKK